MKSLCHRAGAWLLAAAVSIALRADVTPAPLFTDGAVLQRDKPVPVWGTATPGEKVTVTFAGQKLQATTPSDGRWIVFLDPLPASNEAAELTIAGKNTVTVRDVLVGEVWLCSGQSNMEMAVAHAANAEAEIAAANSPLVRHVRIERTVAEGPADKVATTGWLPATPQHVGGFTAVGYYFARDIHAKLGVPVGLVHSSWGGTPVEAWMSPVALRSNPGFKVVDERWEQVLAQFPQRQKTYEEQLAQWTKREETARALGPAGAAAFAKQNPRPRPPGGPNHPSTPTGLFNGMINPLLPYALRGVLWYQGEANTGRAAEYHDLFTAMIKAWRGHFGQGEVSFYWVNLAAFAPANDPTGRTWAFLREAQTKALALPNTGQAVAIDIGDLKDIHPKNKQEVGRRLAALARTRDYGIVGDDTGPTFARAVREGAAMRVHFTHAHGGLIARDRPVQSLEVAGADRVFHPAEGKLEGDTLLVRSTKVRDPVAVRYAWSNAPIANLYNGSGLPAVPFRSDDW